MKTLIVYTSQTGFTKRYAEWLAKKLGSVILTLDEAKRKDMHFFDEFCAIVYGGWAMAGKVVGSEWFLKNSQSWRNKKLALFCVGASPAASPDVDEVLDKLLSAGQKEYINVFYCQGGLDYSKMNMGSKLAMKSLVLVLKKKKNPSKKDIDMVELIEHSYDISDEKYVEPIVEYLNS